MIFYYRFIVVCCKQKFLFAHKKKQFLIAAAQNNAKNSNNSNKKKKIEIKRGKSKRSEVKNVWKLWKTVRWQNKEWLANKNKYECLEGEIRSEGQEAYLWRQLAYSEGSFSSFPIRF